MNEEPLQALLDRLCRGDDRAAEQVFRLPRLTPQGLGAPEVAARTGLHEDSVRRVLRQLARRLALHAPSPARQ